jgi:hypothetical protein
LLESLAQVNIVANVCRFANMRRRLEALAELGTSPTELEEVLAFLGGEGDPEELLDAPMRYDPAYSPRPTRFSDGSWRVFYASRDWDTAIAEVGYPHVLKAAEGIGVPLYYQRLECAVVGNGYDLLVHLVTWPFLTNPRESEAYPNCQTLAREARGNGADGFLTFSARRTDGVNVPVFARAALSDPRIVGSAAIIPHAGGYRVELR